MAKDKKKGYVKPPLKEVRDMPYYFYDAKERRKRRLESQKPKSKLIYPFFGK